jgi:hypothetical protein
VTIKDIVVLDDAARDMVEGKEFYDTQEVGVGNYFWDSLLSDIESLIIYAGVHERHFGLFRLLSKRFPFAIYYEVSGDVAFVTAILPMRQSPLKTRSKLQGRSAS